MSADDPVLTFDDDVNMGPVVIIDEDDENTNNEKTVNATRAPTVETIDLDDETPIITQVETTHFNKESEIVFVNNLKNNRLMDKIVTRCISMENATGMSRVVYKTLLPLYRDANNRFKESNEFRALLKRTYKQLMRDPDHKFLHVKTLCEELKSGGLRRKVPFVTLATNLKSNSLQTDYEELTSRSREINHNDTENIQIHQAKATNQYTNRKRVSVPRTKRKTKRAKYQRKKTQETINIYKKCYKPKTSTRRVINTEKEKTDIIDLDDSETETETAPLPENANVENDNRENDDHQNEDRQNDHQINDRQNVVIIIDETEPNYNINTTTEPNDNINTTTEPNDNINTTTEPNDNINTTTEQPLNQHTEQEDSNKENNHKNGQSYEKEPDYDLLIPACNVVIPPNGFNVEGEIPLRYRERKRYPFEPTEQTIIKRLEKQIASYKEMIDKLEEQEVVFEHPESSSYYLCSKYKESLVKCYKQLCELKGESQEIVKRREIRLNVAKGHPPGPAKRLEQFLNSTIDETGSVEFPDFADVVQCVVDSNNYDNLKWTREQVIQEALGLFRQCGQALRKRRQKREYRDLLSLVRNKNEIDDPAEKDPVLQAKLEENKVIAKVKEEEILERFVRMESNTTRARFRNPDAVGAVGNTAEFETDKDSSDSESESEQNITIQNNITAPTVNNQLSSGESSRSNTNLNLVPTNNLVLTSPPIINFSNVTQNSETNQVLVNNFVVPSTAASSTQNPMLMNLLVIPGAPLYFVPNTVTIQNQSQIRESSITNVNISNNSVPVQPLNNTSSVPFTIHNERGTLDCSKVDDRTNSKSSSLLPEIPIDKINRNSEISLMKNIGNTERLVKEPCNVSGVKENISNTTDGVDKNCDISKEGNTEDVVKIEPMDIQSMLDNLGDDFECEVFDIEDPFLVIEISSDGYSDDEVS